MKKFGFSMQKVLEYDGHVQNREKNLLREMFISYYKLCSEMDKLLKRYEFSKSEYRMKCKTGVVIKEIINLKSYIIDIQSQMETLKNAIKAAEIEIDKQIQKVTNATKEKTSMEKLRDRYYEVYKSLERKEDEIFIDEFVANSTFSRS